jgi:cell division protein FtsB
MIIARKPCTVYDVDLIGIAALVVVVLAACFGTVIPASANANEYQAVRARIAVAHAKLQQASGQLRKLNAEIAALRSGVGERMRSAPKPGALTPFLQRVARLAEQCDLQLAQVVPQATREAAGCVLSDVRFSGRGSALSFIRLLDALARENPYHALQSFQIKQAGNLADPRCTLSWTLRLYMLEDGWFTQDEQGPW